MSEINNILIAIDDETDENIAIQQGLALAKATKCKVTIHAILNEADELNESLFDIIRKDELHQRLLMHHRSRIQDIAQKYNTDNIEVNIDITSGIPFVQTIRKAFDINADITIQSSHPTVREHMTYSSSDWHLMRKSPMPVWIVKKLLPLNASNIVVAIDTMSKADNTTFNKSIIELAATIAQLFKAKLTVYSVWQLVGEEMFRHSPFLKVPIEKINQMLEDQANKAQEKHQELSAWLFKNSSIDTKNIMWQLDKGNARDLIPKYVNNHDTDLLVMGTVDRTGIPGLLIGNTAETVLSNIDCSVLTTKPSLFDGPIKNYQ